MKEQALLVEVALEELLGVLALALRRHARARLVGYLDVDDSRPHALDDIGEAAVDRLLHGRARRREGRARLQGFGLRERHAGSDERQGH